MPNSCFCNSESKYLALPFSPTLYNLYGRKQTSMNRRDSDGAGALCRQKDALLRAAISLPPTNKLFELL